jgi:hypothetical protein
VLEALLGRHGDVEVGERQLVHETTTAEQFWDRWERLHPMWLAAREQLEPKSAWEPLREGALAALREGGLDAGARSPYLPAVLDRR